MVASPPTQGRLLEGLVPLKQWFSILAAYSNYLRGPGHIPDQLNQNSAGGTPGSVFFKETFN